MLRGFARQSKNSPKALGYSGERLLNYFAQPADGLSNGLLIGRSGLVEYADLGTGQPVRAMESQENYIYAVSGGKLWQMERTSRTVTELATVSDDDDTYIATAGRGTAAGAAQIGIVANNTYYHYDVDTATLTTPTPGAVTTPRGLLFANGYFVVWGLGNGRPDIFAVSALDDGTTWDATDFATAEVDADRIMGAAWSFNELWLMGRRTIEVWFPSGGLDFPFTRSGSALFEVGCYSGRSVVVVDNSVIWVSNKQSVYRGAGGSPQVISTPEVEEKIRGSVVEKAFSFKDRGHEHYALKLTDEPTQCYDLTTGLWWEASTGVGEVEWSANDSQTSIIFEFLGTTDGKIATLSSDTYTDDGETIVAEAVSVPIHQGENFSINEVILRVAGGGVDIGRTPQIMLQTSEDGRNWSIEKWRDLPDLGEYYKRAKWTALGNFEGRAQMRTRITDPVPRDIYGMTYG